jgi:hypothetical protein
MGAGWWSAASRSDDSRSSGATTRVDVASAGAAAERFAGIAQPLPPR